MPPRPARVASRALNRDAIFGADLAGLRPDPLFLGRQDKIGVAYPAEADLAIEAEGLVEGSL